MQAALPPETLAAFGGDELRARIFYDKYAARAEDGQPVERTPDQMWKRIAEEIASVEPDTERRAAWTGRFLWLLSDWRMIPGGRIMTGARNPRRVTLANCYVLGSPEDSIQGIFETAHSMAETYKRGGGCGFDISTLRPSGTPVKNAALTSSGAVSFMQLFSTVTGTIGQLGRRGALMITIGDRHPDVLAFARVKRDLATVKYANISVRVSDAFLRAVEQDADWLLEYVNEADRLQVRSVIKARQLWDEIIAGATQFAEPGLLFWDTVQRGSTSEYNGMGVVSTNPCSEAPMGAWDTCTLANINLAAFCGNPFTPKAGIILLELLQAVAYTVRFLDNVLDYNADRHALAAQREQSLRGRRIGVGFTGLADLLIQLGHRYDTPEAVALAGTLFREIKHVAYATSVAIAKEKGAFPAFDADRHLASPFFAEFPGELLDAIRTCGLRNVALLTVPPVGSGAALAGVASGIEPVFALQYIRRSESLSTSEFTVEHPLVTRYRALTGSQDTDPLPPAFVTAHEIDPRHRIAMQAAIQQHVDMGISSCLMAGDSLILTNRGLLDVEELAAGTAEGEFQDFNGDIQSINHEGRPVQITQSYNNGVTKTLTIKAQSGHEITCTPNHRLLVLNDKYETEWKCARDIHVGDILVSRMGLNLFNEEGCQKTLPTLVGRPFEYERKNGSKEIRLPRRMTRGLARLLGYLCSDGSVSPNGFTLCQQENNVLPDFIELAEELFDVDARIQPDSRSSGLVNVVVNSRELREFFRWLGITDHDNITVPKVIRMGSSAAQKEFLKGVTLDGYVSKQHVCVATSVSKKFLKQIQQMLLNFGIDSCLCKSGKPGEQTFPGGRTYATKQSWCLLLSATTGEAFLRRIGCAEDAKTEAAATKFTRTGRLKVTGDVPDFDLRKHFREKHLTQIQSARLYDLFNSTCSPTIYNRWLPRETAREFADIGMKLPVILLDRTYVFRPVMAVGEGPTVQTYDLTVPDGNSYIANGFISHNTINLPRETTPDTVARIYREAWEAGCKGITVYREGSRDGILLTKKEAANRQHGIEARLSAEVNRMAGRILPPHITLSPRPTEQELAQLAQAIDALLKTGPPQLQLIPNDRPLRPRPTLLRGITLAQPAPEGNIQCTVNEVDDEPFELICHGGKAGSDINAWVQALARVISILLRLQRLPGQVERLQLIIDQLEGIAGSRSIGFGLDRVRSGPDGIAQAFRRYLTLKTEPDGNGERRAVPVPPPALALLPAGGPAAAMEQGTSHSMDNGNGFCPRCGGHTLSTENGCSKCPCGFQEC